MNKLVTVEDLFKVKYGINLELVNLRECKATDKDAIPFVSRTEQNNGVAAYVYPEADIKPNPAHTLSVAGGGSVLATFYQPMPYYSGRDLYILIPKNKMKVEEMLFYARCINANKYKYNYGRQANKTLKSILIPEKIQQELMEKLEKNLEVHKRRITKSSCREEKIDLEVNKWQDFDLKDLFDIKGSKTTPLLELEELGKGKYPYVTTQATNNGVGGFFEHYTEEGNVLTVDSAVLGYCSYQELRFTASDHVEKLKPKFKMNKYIAMFMVTILNMEQYRYNYGRKSSQTRMKNVKIKLPGKDGKPDYEFMENYIKSKAYSANL